MRGHPGWSYRPYRFDRQDLPLMHIVRMAPGRDELAFEWLWSGEEPAPETVRATLRRLEDGWTRTAEIHEQTETLRGLRPDCDYELMLESSCQGGTARRLFRTGEVPGTVVNYLHPQDPCYQFSGRFLCSPSLVKAPSGALIASMDVYARGAPQNLTILFRSEDGGRTWRYLSELFPCFWGRLFIHRGCLYMLAVSTEYGDLLIGKSEDEGRTFGTPAVIARGSSHRSFPGFHKAPVRIQPYQHRLWTGVEFGCTERGGYLPMLLSADQDADLLRPENWTMTKPVWSQEHWRCPLGTDRLNCLDGNAAVMPDGTLVDLLRTYTTHCSPPYGQALLLRADPARPENRLEYAGLSQFPGNLSKFELVEDEQAGGYYLIYNHIRDVQSLFHRNILAVAWSRDLVRWEHLTDVCPFGDKDPREVAFQYPAAILDGDALLILSRTAWNGADSFHNSNLITLHRVENIRQYRKREENV